MECVKCDNDKTRVTDTIKYGGAVYRQRYCKLCKHKFWTEETEVYDNQNVRDAIACKMADYRTRKKYKLELRGETDEKR